MAESRVGHATVTDEARIAAYNEKGNEIMRAHAADGWDGDVPSAEALDAASRQCDALLLELLRDVRNDEREECARLALAHEEWANDPGRLEEGERRLIVGAAQCLAREIRARGAEKGGGRG